MISPGARGRIFAYGAPVDMRKGIQTLAGKACQLGGIEVPPHAHGAVAADADLEGHRR